MNACRVFRTISLLWVLSAGLAGCAPQTPVVLPIEIRVLSYNIHHGEGLDGKLDLERIAALINRERPDLVALQEVDRGVRRTGGIDEPAELGRLTGMTAIFEKNIEYQGGDYGNAVLTRLPVIYHRNHHLPQSRPGEQRGMLEVAVRVNGSPLIFYATHFDYHSDDRERLDSVAMFKQLIAAQANVPILLAGDLNAEPCSEVLAQLMEFMTESFKTPATRPFTYPAENPTKRIDYILHNQHPGLWTVTYRIIDEPVASDHRPILAVFQLARAAKRSSSKVDTQPAAAESREPEFLLRNVEQLTTPEMGFDRAGEAYFSPDGTQIIFQAVPRGKQGYQIHVMSLADRKPRMVSTGRGECTCAFFRPDGRKILFASSHLGEEAGGSAGKASGYQRKDQRYAWNFNPGMDIFEANPDGTELKRLTDAPGYDAEGAYSPDGKSIAFTSQRTGDLELWIMNADGSNPRQITHKKGYDGGPFISPDNRRVIFRADRKGDDLLQIFVIDATGQNERQLTRNEFVNWGPYWHPAGHSVIYATSRHGHENYELYLLNVDTGAEQRVTTRPGFDGLPAFRADGRKLMWTSKRGPDGTAQVFWADFTLPGGF